MNKIPCISTLSIFLIFPLCTLCFGIEAGWHDRKAEGWAWYDDGSDEKFEEKETSKGSSPISAKDRLDSGKKVLEEKLAEALLDPTEANIENYMVEQQKWVNQAGQFAKNWSKIVLNNPSLTNSITEVPSSNYGMQIHRVLTMQKRGNFIKALTESHGLIFLYNGEDLISKAFGEVVRAFAKDYGWYLIPISVDGIAFEEFPDTQLDQGLSGRLKTDIFPALYLLDPEDEAYIPIAYGLTSIEQIERNILKQFDISQGDL